MNNPERPKAWLTPLNFLESISHLPNEEQERIIKRERLRLESPIERAVQKGKVRRFLERNKDEISIAEVYLMLPDRHSMKARRKDWVRGRVAVNDPSRRFAFRDEYGWHVPTTTKDWEIVLE